MNVYECYVLLIKLIFLSLQINFIPGDTICSEIDFDIYMAIYFHYC
jgi:hypothetical protein